MVTLEKPRRIAPALVLSTGRCGSTMVSNLLNMHPRVLSLSEFFSYVGVHQLFRRSRVSGAWMWAYLSRQRQHTRLMLRDTSYEEFLYPVDDPGARFTRSDLPPILCATLPHLTGAHEALFDELEAVVRGQPRQPPASHLRHLFGWLCERFGADVWVERSGGSLLFGSRLMREFPDARVIHIYRDGRDTALSMHGHYLFRLIAVTLKYLRRPGIDPLALMRRRRLWDALSPWLTPLVGALVKPDRLPFDDLTLLDSATLWDAMIELGHQTLGALPPDRLLNVRFEDVQAEPELHVRRIIRFIDPSLESEEWVVRASAVPRRTKPRYRQLAMAQQAALTASCRSGLERLGYSV